MGQLIACAATEGIFLASDSRTEFFGAGGEEHFIAVERLIPVGAHAVLASAGAVEGHALCRDFADFAKDEGLADINALMEAAMPFFTGRYDEVMRKMCEKLPVDPLHNMYLLLAGYSAKHPEHPARLFIVWNRPKPPKIEYNQVTNIFTLPRRLGLEYKLAQLLAKKAPLAEIAAAAKEAMQKLANQDEYIGPPFHYLTITAAGVNKV
ncbi:MAG: hypothetical protein C4567_00790 [Deltaproteobacteria bacterium]|nr:MAG: hypothetical protein C4567_00790 [Deltaproteobacteria bacterium]